MANTNYPKSIYEMQRLNEGGIPTEIIHTTSQTEAISYFDDVPVEEVIGGVEVGKTYNSTQGNTIDEVIRDILHKKYYPLCNIEFLEINGYSNIHNRQLHEIGENTEIKIKININKNDYKGIMKEARIQLINVTQYYPNGDMDIPNSNAIKTSLILPLNNNLFINGKYEYIHDIGIDYKTKFGTLFPINKYNGILIRLAIYDDEGNIISSTGFNGENIEDRKTMEDFKEEMAKYCFSDIRYGLDNECKIFNKGIAFHAWIFSTYYAIIPDQEVNNIIEGLSIQDLIDNYEFKKTNNYKDKNICEYNVFKNRFPANYIVGYNELTQYRIILLLPSHMYDIKSITYTDTLEMVSSNFFNNKKKINFKTMLNNQTYEYTMLKSLNTINISAQPGSVIEIEVVSGYSSPS